jgi:hypothetical protein
MGRRAAMQPIAMIKSEALKNQADTNKKMKKIKLFIK